MELPGPSHIIYIPAVFLLGLVIGWIFGSRAARNEILHEQERARAREKRRAERRARAQQD
ncbi:MAG: hypothetical protein D6729_08660 [Deltaproteobacteria bacterium]|nr:MAG: hypothetical protein D6729_08660 [Deltaproteobacteria bacterium]